MKSPAVLHFVRFLFAPAAVIGMCLVTIASPAGGAEPGSRIPAEFKLLFEESFDAPASIERFEFSDAKAWRWSDQGKTGGAIELHKQSEYKTTHRSPFNLAMIRNTDFGDFVMELDMKQSGKEYGHRDMCLYFCFQEPQKFYYTHLATSPDANAHNIFIVNDAPRKSFAPISPKGIDWGNDWQHIRLERIGNAIRVYYNDLDHPVLAADHDAFNHGSIGFGSFDDVGLMDNVRIWSAKASEKPGKLFP